MSESTTKGVDHIMVRVQEAEPLMDLFASRLGLPISWPLTRTEFATYGWITLGNTNLEFWASSNNEDLPANTVLPLFHGFALEPANLQNGIAELDKRGIRCKTPRPYITKAEDGQEVTNFTNSVVLDVSGPLSCIFFCEWGVEGTIFPWREKLTTQERRRKEQRQLDAVSGGVLGVTGLLAIRQATSDVPRTEAKWRSITGQNTGPISLGAGTDLSLMNGNEEWIDSVVIGVASLEKTRKVLDELRLLGESSGDECALRTDACMGLNFRFRESRPQ